MVFKTALIYCFVASLFPTPLYAMLKKDPPEVLEAGLVRSGSKSYLKLKRSSKPSLVRLCDSDSVAYTSPGRDTLLKEERKLRRPVSSSSLKIFENPSSSSKESDLNRPFLSKEKLKLYFQAGLEVLKDPDTATTLFSLNYRTSDLEIICHKESSLKKGIQMFVVNKSKMLGKGAQGAVYLAEKINTQDFASLKVAAKIYSDTPKDYQREITTLRYLKRLEGAFDIRTDDKVAHYLFSPYYAGKNLLHVLYDFSGEIPVKRQLDPGLKLALIHGVLKEVSGLHERGVLHGDIKTENFIVNMTDGEVTVHLIDFGTSEILKENSKYSTQGMLYRGTLGYQAPERFCHQTISDHYGIPTEVWSMGVVLSEIYSRENYQLFISDKVTELKMKETEFPDFKYSDLMKAFPDTISFYAEKNGVIEMIQRFTIPEESKRPESDDLIQFIKGVEEEMRGLQHY